MFNDDSLPITGSWERDIETRSYYEDRFLPSTYGKDPTNFTGHTGYTNHYLNAGYWSPDTGVTNTLRSIPDEPGTPIARDNLVELREFTQLPGRTIRPKVTLNNIPSPDYDENRANWWATNAPALNDWLENGWDFSDLRANLDAAQMYANQAASSVDRQADIIDNMKSGGLNLGLGGMGTPLLIGAGLLVLVLALRK